MNTRHNQLERTAEQAKKAKEEFADALKRGLLVLRFIGHCKCGLMLTEQDRNQNKETYHCPGCGVSGPLVGAA